LARAQEKRFSDVQIEVERLEHEIAQLRNTVSWRLTKPLRVANYLLSLLHNVVASERSPPNSRRTID
jgi:hypothetical protein